MLTYTYKHNIYIYISTAPKSNVVTVNAMNTELADECVQASALCGNETSDEGLGSLNDEEMQELIEELKNVPMDDIGQIDLGPERVAVDQVGGLPPNIEDSVGTSLEDCTPIAPCSTVSSVEESRSQHEEQEVSMLFELCNLCKTTIDQHKKVLTAKRQLNLLKQESCFVPVTPEDIKNVRTVRAVAEHLPFLFSEKEALGFLSSDKVRRQQSINKANKLRKLCDGINHECDMATV